MRVSESFYSVQGEGITQGVPAYFIRLQGCNLDCSWCDTTEVWRKGVHVENEELEKRIEEAGQLNNVLEGRTHLVWTGGEPTMPHHQDAIVSFLYSITDKHPHNNIYNELETNGTNVIGYPSLYAWMEQINCSPKTRNSDVPVNKRINPSAIEQIRDHPNSWFKFVISNKADVYEAQTSYIIPFGIEREKVILMPEVTSRADIGERTKECYEFSKKFGYRTITRGQVLAWDKVTGV